MESNGGGSINGGIPEKRWIFRLFQGKSEKNSWMIKMGVPLWLWKPKKSGLEKEHDR